MDSGNGFEWIFKIIKNCAGFVDLKEFFLPASSKSSKGLLFTLLFFSLVKLRLFSAFNPT
jgi:hypothetical protein